MTASSFARQSQVRKEPVSYQIPFDKYICKDRLGREVTFYLSKASRTEKLPIALLIQGSGGQSIWTKRGDRVFGGLQNVLLAAARGRVRVLAVEKPGVSFCFEPPQPGVATGCEKQFLEEHTLPRWAEANLAALRAVRTLAGVDPKRTLAIGHSEGGIVAARVAAEDPSVTHAALLAGGGPSQLFDMALAAGADNAFQTWADIRRDPNSITKFVWGHPYRRWSSFMVSSPLEELMRTKARVFLAAGSEDKSEPVVTYDVLLASLLAKGRDVTGERIVGVDHGFRGPNGDGGPEGFTKVFGEVLDWFLK